MKKSKFTITEDHLKVLRCIYVERDASHPRIPRDRPFGNSNVRVDVLEAIGEKPIIDMDGEEKYTEAQGKLAEKIAKEANTALQICLCTGRFRLGDYVMGSEYNDLSWKLA